MTSIIAIGAANSLLLAILALSKKKRTLSDLILGQFLLIFSATFLIGYISVAGNYSLILAFLINISLLIAPLFYIYIASLIGGWRTFNFRFLFHFLPYLLSSLYWTTFFVTEHKDKIKVLFTPEREINPPFLFTLFRFMDDFAVPVYIILCYLLLKKHRKRISDEFSYTEGINLKWINTLLGSMALIWLVWAIFDTISIDFTLITEESGIKYGYMFSTLFILYIGYFGLRQVPVFHETPQIIVHETKEITQKYKKSSLKKNDIDKNTWKLEELMKSRKPFLNSELCLHDLANLIQISPHHLSQIINQSYNTNFYDFINKFRVKEFKNQIQVPKNKNLTILAVALDCGFNSKSSFNRIFKKFENCTPTKYCRSLKLS